MFVSDHGALQYRALTLTWGLKIMYLTLFVMKLLMSMFFTAASLSDQLSVYWLPRSLSALHCLSVNINIIRGSCMKVRRSVCVWLAGWSVTELMAGGGGGQNSGICMQSSGSWPVNPEEFLCSRSLSLSLSLMGRSLYTCSIYTHTHCDPALPSLMDHHVLPFSLLFHISIIPSVLGLEFNVIAKWYFFYFFSMQDVYRGGKESASDISSKVPSFHVTNKDSSVNQDSCLRQKEARHWSRANRFTVSQVRPKMIVSV